MKTRPRHPRRHGRGPMVDRSYSERLRRSLSDDISLYMSDDARAYDSVKSDPTLRSSMMKAELNGLIPGGITNEDAVAGAWRRNIPTVNKWSKGRLGRQESFSFETTHSQQVQDRQTSSDSDESVAYGLPVFARWSGGIRVWCPESYSCLAARVTTKGKMALLLIFALFHCLRFEVNQIFAYGSANLLSILVVSYTISLTLALAISLLMEGRRAVGKVFKWQPVWRFGISATLFAIAQCLVAQAYALGTPIDCVQVLGYMYMPFSALLSQWVFNKHYGMLETMSLSMVTLAVMAYMSLRSRYKLLYEYQDKSIINWFNDHVRTPGVSLVLTAVCFSAVASILAERIFKQVSAGVLRVEGLRHNRFYMWKVHLDLVTLIVLLVIWALPHGACLIDSTDMQCDEDDIPEWFGKWTYRELLLSCALVIDSWTAGLMTKHFSTVIRSMVASLAMVIFVLVSDPLFEGTSYRWDVRGFPQVLLMIIIFMSALIFQTGRINLRTIRKNMHLTDETSSAPRPSAGTVPAEGEGGVDVEEDEEEASSDFVASEATFCNGVLPLLMQTLRFVGRYSLIILYILMDAIRNLLNNYALRSSMINPNSMTIVMFGCSILIMAIKTYSSTGCTGLWKALDVNKIVMYFPVAILGAITACMTSMAYALGISPALATVLGKIYTPVLAIGSIWITRKYYMWLEWFALTIMTLAVISFGYLSEYDIEKGLDLSRADAMWLCAGGAVSSAFMSLLSEKLLKRETDPFSVQKMRMDIGSTLFTFLFVPIISLVSNRNKDVVWFSRPVDGSCDVDICYPEPSTPNWPWIQHNESVCLPPDMGGPCGGACACHQGLFIGWEREPMLFMALAVNILYGLLVGQIVMRFSSIHRAMSDAVSLILLYWLGDPLMKKLIFGTPISESYNDFILDFLSFIMPLSAVTFMLASSEMEKVMRCKALELSLEEEEESNLEEEDEDGDGSSEEHEYATDGEVASSCSDQAANDVDVGR